MNVIVNPDTCIGCGLCASLCDTVFTMNDDGLSEVIADAVTEDVAEDIHEAVVCCPVEAISIEE